MHRRSLAFVAIAAACSGPDPGSRNCSSIEANLFRRPFGSTHQMTQHHETPPLRVGITCAQQATDGWAAKGHPANSKTANAASDGECEFGARAHAA